MDNDGFSELLLGGELATNRKLLSRLLFIIHHH